MRHWLLLVSLVSCVQAQEQRPNFQPGWPCTGKERTFDPVYSEIAEATGGHLFLGDKSEPSAMGKIAIGGMRHNATIIRGTAKLESFKEVAFPVDAEVESLFVIASVQCLQIIEIYGPDGQAMRAELVPGGEENRYRAGWIATIPHPARGPWTLRIAGQGYYSYAVEAKTKAGFQASFDASNRRVTARDEANLSLVGAAGEELGPLSSDGRIPDGIRSFRVRLSGIDANGSPLQRMDPRLYRIP